MFYMFKSIIAAALLTVTTAVPAFAQKYDYCITEEGIEFCADYGFKSDRVVITGHGLYADFNIKCTIPNSTEYQWEWEINEVAGNVTDEDLHDFSNGYCQGRLGVEEADDTSV